MGIFISRKNILRCPKCRGTYFEGDGLTVCLKCGCKLISKDEYKSFAAYNTGPDMVNNF